MRSITIIYFIVLLYHANAESFKQNNVGNLHLSEKKWEFQYILNLTEYRETTDLLQECIDTLTNVCERGQNSLCPYFLGETKNINNQLQADISKMDILIRRKRFLIFIPIVIGVAALSFWGGMFIAKLTLGSLKNSIQENLNIIEHAANMTMTAINLQEQYIKDADERFSKIENSVNNNTLNLELYTQFFTILSTVLFSAQKHERIQVKLNHVYSGEYHHRLFEIIEFAGFLRAMEGVNEKLEPDLMLPEITSMRKNNFIETFSELNDTHLVLSVDLPVIRKVRLTISELIPFPMREDGKLYMLDTKTIEYYVDNSTAYILSNDVRKSLCKAQDKNVICNVFLENYAEKASNCIQNLVIHNSDVGCNYKQIEYKNYFIKNSDTFLYAYIVHPIRIVRNCRGENEIVDLKNSQQISLPLGCNIYKYSEKIQYGNDKTVMMDNTTYNPSPKIDLSINQTLNMLEIIPLWDKYEVQYIKAKTIMTRLGEAIPLQRQNIENVSLNNSLSIYYPVLVSETFLRTQ